MLGTAKDVSSSFAFLCEPHDASHSSASFIVSGKDRLVTTGTSKILSWALASPFYQIFDCNDFSAYVVTISWRSHFLNFFDLAESLPCHKPLNVILPGRHWYNGEWFFNPLVVLTDTKQVSIYMPSTFDFCLELEFGESATTKTLEEVKSRMGIKLLPSLSSACRALDFEDTLQVQCQSPEDTLLVPVLRYAFPEKEIHASCDFAISKAERRLFENCGVYIKDATTESQGLGAIRKLISDVDKKILANEINTMSQVIVL
jgi:hypothetical protein